MKLIGACLGIKAIPEKFLANLELKEVIFEIAKDLYIASVNNEYSYCMDLIWQAKYIDKTFKM